MTYIDPTKTAKPSIFATRTRTSEASPFDLSSQAPGTSQDGTTLNSDSSGANKLSSALWSLQSGADDGIGQAADKTPEEEFGELADMDIGDRMMQQYLGEHGLSKEDFANLPAEEREKIVEEVRHRVLEQSKNQQLHAGPAGDEGLVASVGATAGSSEASPSRNQNNGRREN
ncbi:hypothetical protein [Rhizobium sp. Rhizsp82]|uniref:hypothetical protein n=1 Tax=Rhizobium sp. Rhizsp82 TaxID=3243057 RepID=UPI0039B41E64